MQKGTLYFHSACFDGLVSGVLAWVFLESKKWQFEEFIPLKYDVRGTWLSASLETPAAVVDFLYHPDAEFWADHHATTFLTPTARKDFSRRRRFNCLLFDENAGSCATLLWNSLELPLTDTERYREAVLWAEKIDTANYASIDEAILGAPALRIKLSLMVQIEPGYSRMLLEEMRSGDLARIATLAPVTERFTEARRRIVAGLTRVAKHIQLSGDIALFDIESSDDDIVSRYVPYKFFPQARYSIGLVRSSRGITITAMRNPWMAFRSVYLGKILENFGGGGHERIGSVLIPNDKSDLTQQIVDRLLTEIRSHSPTESITV
jgi:hypothetical protein